jgi:hypothetical protein
MYRRVATTLNVITHLYMAGDAHSIGEYTPVPNHRIMPEMAISHKEVLRSNVK